MKAIVYSDYGSPDVLQLRDVPKPVPKPGEVLIRVHACSINDWDWGLLQGTPLVTRLMSGARRPKTRILGSDVAGRIEALGDGAQRFRIGDDVFGDLSGRWGGFAEYVCAPETALALKPPAMTFEQAAAIPQAAMLAVQGLRDVGRLQAGQRLLVNGAGGGVGTFAVQLAKEWGAEVTAVDSGEKLEMLRALGADHVIDYTREDFTKSGRQYDLILDVKTARPVRDHARALKRGGMYATVGGSMVRLFQAVLLWPWFQFIVNKSVRVVVLRANKDLELMKALFEAGKVVPVLDGAYALEDVPDAFRYFGSARHKGKVVITVREPV